MNTYSVIITTHHRPAFLGRAISSVKAQTDVRHQIVVVSDDASADTYKVASDLLSNEDVFVQRGGQPGPAASRNFGTLLAKGDYIIFLDDDDAFSPDYLYEANRHASQTEVLYTDYYSVFERLDNGGSVLVDGEKRSLAAKDLNSIHVKNFIPQTCLIYPAEAVQGRETNPSLVLNEDWDFILNVMTGSPFRHIPIFGPVIYTRLQADNRGRRNDHLLVETYQTIYKRWPAPTHDLKLARQAFFATHGVSLMIEDL